MEERMPDYHSPQDRLTALVAQHQGMLLKVCYAYLCNIEDARDAVQDTFLKAYRGLDSFRGECSEQSWLIRIARNTCLDMRRSAWFRRVDRRVRVEELPEASTPEATEEERELTAAVMNLPAKLKDAVILYYFQGLSVQETAEILGIAQSSVSGRLSRARNRLKIQLEGVELND